MQYIPVKHYFQGDNGVPVTSACLSSHSMKENMARILKEMRKHLFFFSSLLLLHQNIKLLQEITTWRDNFKSYLRRNNNPFKTVFYSKELLFLFFSNEWCKDKRICHSVKNFSLLPVSSLQVHLSKRMPYSCIIWSSIFQWEMPTDIKINEQNMPVSKC